jgi:hypothetical protein
MLSLGTMCRHLIDHRGMALRKRRTLLCGEAQRTRGVEPLPERLNVAPTPFQNNAAFRRAVQRLRIPTRLTWHSRSRQLAYWYGSGRG